MINLCPDSPREGTRINKIKSEKGEIYMDTAEIEKKIREYYKQFLCQQIW